MKYPQFERMTLAFGGIAILATSLLSMPGEPTWQEFIAQAMLLGVLGAALHWGRKGGFIAAALASFVYVLLRLPLFVVTEISTAAVIMLLARVLAYGLIGIVGGEVFGRIKYTFARIEDNSVIDDWSRVYNQRFASNAIVAALGRHRRYGEAFSLIALALSPALTSALSPRRQRSVIRGVANHIRTDVRLVDEVARLDDGRFLVLLPHTPRDGANVAAERIGAGLRQTLGARDESVVVTVLSAAEDRARLSALAEELSLPYADEDEEYSSEADSTRYPADRRASSAEASVLKTSIADPELTSKQ